MRTVTRLRSDETAGIRSVGVLVVVALVLGAVVAPFAFGAAKDLGESSSQIAVVDVETTIAPATADPIKDALQEARHNESIEAVVLRVNTPGGALSATESVALEVERTAEEMPVVVSVQQMAASGGYYVSAPADHIVANPSAQVGSVGINFAFVNSGASSSAIQSGPDKSGGYTEEEAIAMADAMVEGFYGTVLDHRGDDLELSREQLAYAKVYPSQEAVHNGMIDEVGTLETALQRAAERADVDRYEVTEFDTTPEVTGTVIVSGANATWEQMSSTERVEALVDPAPGVETPVPLAMYGSIPEERVIVTTAGGPGATAGQGDAANQAEVSVDG